MEKEFKPHKMYKGDISKFVKTMKEHLALKKKGYNHTEKKYIMKKLIDKLQHAWNKLMYKLTFHNYKE